MGKMERDADFRRDSKKSAKDKKYADMSIRSFQSGPIPVFCDLKSYDDIRIRQQARSQKSQEKILSERTLSFKPEKIAKKTSEHSRYKQSKRDYTISETSLEKLPSFTNKNTNKLMFKQFAMQFNAAIS